MPLYRRQFPLHHAAMHGRLDLVKELVYEGMLTNVVDFKDCTPLHYAAFYGHFDVCKFLCTKCDLDPLLSDGRSPILLAALCDHKNVVDLLIKAGADLTIVDEYNYSLLHIASYRRWIDVVLEILKYNKDLDVNVKTVDGYTALWFSAYAKDFGIFQALVERGADLRYIDADGWTLLHCAARSGSIEMVKLVISCVGIDFNAKTASGDTALFLAVFYRHKNIAELLIRSGVHVMCDRNKNISILHDACRREAFDLLNACIEMGMDVHATNYLGDTPLHVACTYGHILIIKLLLLKANAKCYVRNNRNRSPFNNLIKYVGNIELIELCFSHGAFFQQYDVDSIQDFQIPYLEHRLLRNVKLWTLSMINEFNHKILPEIYKISKYARLLPPPKKLWIHANSNIGSDIRRSLNFEKYQNRVMDLSERPPIILKFLAAKALISNFDDLEPRRMQALTPVHALELFLDNRH